MKKRVSLGRFASWLVLLGSSQGFGQDFATLASVEELPNEPSLSRQMEQTGNPVPAAQGTARVEGIVEDVEGARIPQATVVLAAPGKIGERSEVAGADGKFTFTGLLPGPYRLIIEAPGLLTFTTGEFVLKADESLEAPKIAMKISTSSSVTVVASPNEIAAAEVHEQEKQRVLGIFPNFYTSYVWNAQPMTPKLKFRLAFHSLLDPVHFIIIAGAAGAEQIHGTYPGYGSGPESYGKRYGAALADSVTGRIIGSGILPTILHQDPRYFYQGSGGFRSRAWHAVISAVVCRGDNGKSQPNVSHLMGNLAAGGIANLYHPESSRGVGLVFETLGITTAGKMAGNLFREFVLRGFVPSVPDYANGKQAH